MFPGLSYCLPVLLYLTEIPCSIFFDLPNSYQAFLFATVNGNQKRVDRSLALEQFGFNVDEEPRESWTPEKIAVYYSRRLNIKDAPFHFHIRVAPRDDQYLVSTAVKSDWFVSTATVVDGIVDLISKNAKRDRVEMQQQCIFKGRNRKQLSKIKDDSPLRVLYLKGDAEHDELIYNIVIDFFEVMKNYVWIHCAPNSFITKTIGIQASFDFLKRILLKESATLDSINFTKWVKSFEKVDFSDTYFQQSSSVGRSRIRNLMLIANNLDNEQRIREEDRNKLNQLLHESNL
ncbi:ParB N-terminal domain-containing protein [Mucilaginibacter paludis]|uniref:hypothetical protein n=1 Tax=Mucilaginibacter paludis TaxID=423351 RepID=UPI000318AE76|nr:hypothetical protein [Mucilaginibacter paludis]